ncbi:hypothetical protein [Phormidium tenue]|uniref:Uncharacterized protein n=1 Tax=Phormidium tenue NIES-30 TaxID=549789 RepID=A0A1U7J7F0_9CYAN|nr:hypothetical protein [Phormidium tenue]MBD2231516.1 hypothetical protein [Phormidium tenue FACHB-1052]OKH49095.1 hypothetical protein NIES30_07975 [Phormidium tenue NIES-30]
MKLSEADAALFFELMWSLQIYVNQQLKLVPHIEDPAGFEARPTEEKIAIRDALYQNPELIDRFIQENPQGLGPDKIEILDSWKNFIEGTFYIERFLKKYAVFISNKDVVYGVLGLWDSFDDMIHKSYLPLMVKAVLLPFKGQIVYDGLLQSTNIHFGGGIRSELKQIYLAAKNAGRIIESLDPVQHKAIAQAAPLPNKPKQDFAPLLDDLAQQAKVLRGGNGQPPINSPIFSLIKASLELGQLSVNEPDNEEQMMKSLDKAERALKKIESALYGPRGWML